jgi:release factor glutamine methyltransferase
MQAYLRENLVKKKLDRPSSTALLLLGHVLQKPKSWILAHTDYELHENQINALEEQLKVIISGVPLPYVLGTWEFFGKFFKVTPDVLIPRPETEGLVEKAIDHIQKFGFSKILDVGTGSGVIAISLAYACPGAEFIAIDISYPALLVAKENAFTHHQTHIRFVQSDMLLPLNAKFNLIAANLPYIPKTKLMALEVSRWEPHQALDGGETGLNSIQRLLDQAHDRLLSPGVILLEIESSVGEESLKAAKESFPNADCQLHQDLAGHDRIIEILQP